MSVMIPEIVVSYIYHIPISHCFVEQLTSAFSSPLITQNLSNHFTVQDFYNDFMLKIACTGGLSVWSRFHVDLKCTRCQFFFFSIQVLPCPVDLIREARAQIG